MKLQLKSESCPRNAVSIDKPSLDKYKTGNFLKKILKNDRLARKQLREHKDVGLTLKRSQKMKQD